MIKTRGNLKASLRVSTAVGSARLAMLGYVSCLRSCFWLVVERREYLRMMQRVRDKIQHIKLSFELWK